MNVTMARTETSIKFPVLNNQGIFSHTKGSNPIDPIIPIKAKASRFPIFLTFFCIKKSPNPQQSIAANADNNPPLNSL